MPMCVQTVARVWDALLYEGPKVLYRVALALLKGCEAQLLTITNTGDLIGEIKEATRGAHDRDALMKVSLCLSPLECVVCEECEDVQRCVNTAEAMLEEGAQQGQLHGLTA